MTANLKPYPAYKDSGMEWLGEVPDHWEVLPNRALFDEVKDRDWPNEEMLSVTIRNGVLRQADLLADSSQKDSSNLDRSNYKLVQPGDVVYNKMRAWQGAIGVSPYRGIVSPAYVIQCPRENGRPRYFHHLFRSPAFAREAERWSYGITSDMWSLRPQHFNLIQTCLPPASEQDAIVRFIDYIDRRIRRYIRAKQKLIQLLEEQKQAIIHRAVTRGLDPDAPLKDCGVEWLGDVPQHWEVRRLAHACSLIVDGTHFSPPNQLTGEHLYITARNIKEDGVVTSNATYISESDHQLIYRRCPVRKGDILYVKDGATAGVATVNDIEEQFSMLSSVALLRPNPALVTPDYLKLVLNDAVFKGHALRVVVGGAMTRFTIELIKRFMLVVPPKVEQYEIAESIYAKTSPLRTAMACAKREIDLLNEYRTRLIADVVTGKLDVRGYNVVEESDTTPQGG